jgi:TolB-like protein
VRISLLFVVCSLLLPGCLSRPPEPVPRLASHVSLAGSTNVAIDDLLASMHPQLGLETTILIASLVDLDDVEASTTIGRLVAEEAAVHLIQRGYQVPEVRLTSALHLRDEGWFILSRDANKLRTSQYDAGVALTGTISSLGGITYVNFRLVRISDGIALAAQSMELPDRFTSR